MKSITGFITVYLFCTIFTTPVFAQKIDYTQNDRDRLVKIETILKEFKDSIDKRFEQIDKRFEQIDKRFEQIDNRFEDMFNFLWILTGIFTALTVGILGFSYWDRRIIIK